MIKIDGFESGYTIDLNNSTETNYKVTIDSRDDNGKVIPWSVLFISNTSITYDKEGIDILYLSFNLEAIKSTEYIIIESYNKEKSRIEVKPNLKESMPKHYTFRLVGYDTSDKDTIKFKVKSECNGEYIKWKCTYDGKPYDYVINKGDNTIEISLKSIPLADIIGLIELEQEKSGMKLSLHLLHHKEDKMELHMIT